MRTDPFVVSIRSRPSMPFRSTSSDGSQQPHVQERCEALAARERFCVGAAFLQQPERVVEAFGAPVLE